ncbi:hypothetical protein [Marinitoga lauensis]|uniref:hypothetical protein n=1 Tax=Marinitoga lauensis TaxID=2201189 RepID=UPI001010F51A|nr:hypothetical protein [Marinitoga lauensis]
MDIIDSNLPPRTKKLPYYYFASFLVLKYNELKKMKKGQKQGLKFKIAYKELLIKLNIKTDFKKYPSRLKNQLQKILTFFKKIGLISSFTPYSEDVEIKINSDFFEDYEIYNI